MSSVYVPSANKAYPGCKGARAVKPLPGVIVDYQALVTLNVCCQRLQDVLEIMPKDHPEREATELVFSLTYALKLRTEKTVESVPNSCHMLDDDSCEDADDEMFGQRGLPGAETVARNKARAEKGDGRISSSGKLIRRPVGRPSRNA